MPWSELQNHPARRVVPSTPPTNSTSARHPLLRGCVNADPFGVPWFRTWCRKTYRFESGHPHRQKTLSWSELQNDPARRPFSAQHRPTRRWHATRRFVAVQAPTHMVSLGLGPGGHSPVGVRVPSPAQTSGNALVRATESPRTTCRSLNTTDQLDVGTSNAGADPQIAALRCLLVEDLVSSEVSVRVRSPARTARHALLRAIDPPRRAGLCTRSSDDPNAGTAKAVPTLSPPSI